MKAKKTKAPDLIGTEMDGGIYFGRIIIDGKQALERAKYRQEKMFRHVSQVLKKQVSA